MPRERDLSFEALVEVTNANVAAERGALNAALAQIREASPELDDADLAMLIQMRARSYRQAWPDITLTPTALAKHWGRVEEEAPKPTYPTRTEGGTICTTCDGDKMVLVGYRRSESEHPGEKGFDLMAPCPDCNSGANGDFWRADGSRFRLPDPGRVREMMGG